MTRLLPLLTLSLAFSGCAARTLRFVGYRLTGTAPSSVACHEDGPAKWCLYAPQGPASADVVYFLHYATGDERSWDRLGLARAFYGEFRKLGRPAPRVVTVSYGTHWVISRKLGIRQTVPLQDFEALRARIEENLGPIDRRFAWGMSQGGYNAAEIVLSDPAHWAGAALSCPAIYGSSPYVAPPKELFPRGAEGRALFTSRLPDEKSWLTENPLALAAAAVKPPPFWIEADTQDEFGFLEGAVAFEAALRAASAPVTLVKTQGEHCLIDARAAARFIASAETAGAKRGR